MNKTIHILLIGINLLFLASCDQAKITTEDSVSTIEITDIELHTTMPSGLGIDVYELKGPPGTEPLIFFPVSDQSQEKILAVHNEERKQMFANNSFFDAMSFSMKIQYGESELIAHEKYTAYDEPNSGSLASALVEVILDGQVIYTADAGEGSPLTPLQGLWSSNQDWILEYAFIKVTYNEKENSASSEATGHLVQNGILLNEQYNYDEIFGFQLLNEKPFYFFEKNGEIGISYDEKVTMLGFEEIPHYGCCSAGILNPNRSQNMVSFFAEKNNTWYYCEIGVYE